MSKRELQKIAREIKQIKAMLTVTGYDLSFVKKVEKITNSKFMGAEDTGVGQLYSFDVGLDGYLEIEVSYESEDEYGEPQDDQTWFVGNREYYSERDLLKYLGKIADEYRRYR